MSYFVYILRTSSNTLYVGQTNNLEERIKQHRDKKSRGSKYMKSFESFELVYSETHPTRSDALKREYQLKQFTKKQKEELVGLERSEN